MSNQCVNLVAGVAGFVGTHLAEAMLQKGEKVIGVDNQFWHEDDTGFPLPAGEG